MHWRTIALCGQLPGNDLVGDAPPHCVRGRGCSITSAPARSLSDPTGTGIRSATRLSSSPDDTRLNPFRCGSMKDDLVDKAAQQGLLLRPGEQSLPPNGGEMLTNVLERRLKLLAQRDRWARGLLVLSERFLSALELGKGTIPARLK